MSHDYSVAQSSSWVEEKVVEEPEVTCEEQIGQSLQLEQLGEANFSLRKCEGVRRPRRRVKNGIARRKTIVRRKAKALKIPKVIEKIIDIVNVWQHENFLEVAEKFFQTSSPKQPRGRCESRNSIATRNSDLANKIQVFDNNNL